MEDNNMEKPSSGSKKITLEELDQDELLKRCKNYLALAQRAKVARDDAQQKEASLLGRISALEDQLANEKTDFVNKEEQLKSDNLSLVAQIADLTSQLKSREGENHLLVSSGEEMQTKLKNLEENYGQQKNGFVEELNKMNDVLKQRGEAITRLEEKCQISEKDFKTKTETLLQLVAEKERKIEQLESEVNRFETQSEMMSTSTVCKVEEIHRMKDVEDSLEDRYNKLKMLAVRMKKKISEQNTQLQEKENQIAMLKTDEKGNNIRNSPLNLQAVQKDIDRLNDELDTKKAEMKLLKKDCENAIKELANSKQMAEEFKNEASVLKTTASNLEKSKAALENSIQELRILYDESRKENESEKIVRAELSRECDRLKNESRQLNNIIEELNRSNQAVKQESKKQSVLELELTDYEKSVSELNGKLDSLQKELCLRQNLYEQINDENVGLKDQIQLLEQQISTEQQRATDLKMALDATQLQLNASQNEVKQQRIQIQTVTEKAESKESEVDNLKIKLSDVNSELHKVQTTSALHIDALRKQILALEESLTTAKADKDSLQLECSELRAEYENYKIRAMSVLKKKKTEEHPLGLSSKDKVDDLNTDQVEREMLQRVVDALKTKIAELESQLALSQSEVSSLRMEKERTAASQAATVEAMQQRLGRAETEMEVVKREHQGQIARLQGDNQLLASLHREQIDGLKIRHSQEIVELQNKLDDVRLETTRLQKIVSSANSNRTASPLIKGDQRRDEIVYERERSDGSDEESVHSRRQDIENNKRKPMPLDLLLNSTLALEDSVVAQPESEPISIDKYNESLAIVEKRCNHLAALLAESEANEARLSQLTDALKEEIRRTERAEERQKHIENLEYLKNVVLKFVTLPRGEERSRLIPVLTTLLRLSPAEVQEVHQTFTRVDGAVRPMAWGGVFNYFAPNQ